MVNKDPNYTFYSPENSIKYKEFYDSLAKNDRFLYDELIKAVNSQGYFIQYTGQLNYIDKNDQCLVPILLKYYGLFENSHINNVLIRYLGLSRSPNITGFLLNEFKKPNTEETFNLSRRGFSSSALNSIKDKRFVKGYIKIVENKETRYDSMLIITLLGKLKAEEALPTLIDVLSDNDERIQTSAISALGNFKGHTELIPLLEPFLKSDNKNHRGQARNAINKIKGKKANSEWEK